MIKKSTDDVINALPITGWQPRRDYVSIDGMLVNEWKFTSDSKLLRHGLLLCFPYLAVCFAGVECEQVKIHRGKYLFIQKAFLGEFLQCEL